MRRIMCLVSRVCSHPVGAALRPTSDLTPTTHKIRAPNRSTHNYLNTMHPTVLKSNPSVPLTGYFLVPISATVPGCLAQRSQLGRPVSVRIRPRGGSSPTLTLPRRSLCTQGRPPCTRILYCICGTLDTSAWCRGLMMQVAVRRDDGSAVCVTVERATSSGAEASSSTRRGA